MDKKKIWYKLARNYIRAGAFPFPVTDVVINILKEILTEAQAKFLLQLKKPSYNLAQIEALTDLSEEELKVMLEELADLGALTAIPSRSTGVMVYRLPPFFPGLLEFTLMKGEKGEKQEKLARLWERFFQEIVSFTQMNYDKIMELFENAPSIDRIIPVEEELDTGEERVLRPEKISEILEMEENKPIGVATCYCRHRKDLLEEPCQKTDLRKNCIMFGRAAQFCISHGFAEEISKEEASQIFKQSEEEGLVHKAFHSSLDPDKEIDGICNCCSCCCGTFTAHYAGGTPFLDLTTHIAQIDRDKCSGCGECVIACNARAIELRDDKAFLIAKRCIGCGLCALACESDAIHLMRIKPRKVFVPPPKITTD